MKLNQKDEEYPSLEKEMKLKKNVIPLRYVCEDKAKQIEEDLEKEVEFAKKIQYEPDPYRFAGYNPTVIDFIRRCDTEEQAMEILDFLEKKGDLDNKEATEIRNQLLSEGLRSFGSKKEAGFYFSDDE